MTEKKEDQDVRKGGPGDAGDAGGDEGDKGFDLNAFFTGLSETLNKAVEDAKAGDGDGSDDGEKKGGGEDTAPDLGKAVEELTAQVGAIQKALTSDDEGSVKTLITKMVGDHEATRSALEKALERIVTLEGGSAVKKSIDGDQDGDSKGGDEGDVKKSGSGLSDALSQVAKQAHRTGRGSLTLTG